MFVTFAEYTGFGYKSVDEGDFDRYELMAAQTVRLYTQDRVTPENIDATNKRGVCELVDLMQEKDQMKGVVLSSFSNGRYSESSDGDKSKSPDERAIDVLDLYFTPDQLWRGVR